MPIEMFIGIGLYLLGMVIGAPFGWKFFKLYKYFKATHNVNIWTDFRNATKVLLGKPLDGVEFDEVDRQKLKSARVAVIFWKLSMLLISFPGFGLIIYTVITMAKHQ